VDAAALLSDLESPAGLPGRPWSHTDSLPPARSDLPDRHGVRKLSYSHLDCIDFIIQRPEVTQNELAQRYGYTPSWISLVIASDAFQAELAKRRDEVLSPEIRASVEERFKALIHRSQGVLLEKLNTPGCPPALALGVLGTASKALGYGARDLNVQVNQTFVVELPRAAESSQAWSETHRVIDVQPVKGV